MENDALQYPSNQMSASQRITVPAEVYPYRAGLVGGIVAGAVMALVMAEWGALTGRGVWFPVNLIAATVLRDLQAESLQMLAQFSLAGALVGTLIHFALSIGLGFLFATLLPTLPGSAFVWALIIGPILWFTAQYLALPLVNPRMEALVHVPSFAIAHVIYSLVLGWWISRTAKIVCCEPGTTGIRQMFLGR
ncbi:MAG: hypothetical protein ACE5LU_20575 [Anaerolineae bacterium]